jgi:hypothetical protein
MRTRAAFILGAAALSLNACAATDGAYGPGYAYGYDSPYASGCYNGLYGGYAIGNCGWYDGFFYPGFGDFVFDRHHHRHRMTGSQHDYFTRQARGPDGGHRVGLGSSSGIVPPGVSQRQPTPPNRVGPARIVHPNPRAGVHGPRSGFGPSDRGGHGSSIFGGSGGTRGL